MPSILIICRQPVIFCPKIEDLDLEDLQGAQGLKALRVTVNLQATPAREQTLPELVRAALDAGPKVVNLRSD